jgi:aminopeptidase-like protein
VDTWGSNDVVDIQEEIDLPVAQIKRALTELNKKSLVSKDLQQ